MRLDDMERFVQDAEEAAMKSSDDEEPGTDDDDEGDALCCESMLLDQCLLAAPRQKGWAQEITRFFS